MRLYRGETYPTWKARLENWHPYYAWLPILVGDQDTRWLEWIERKGTYHFAPYIGPWSWEYRARPEMPEEKAA